MDLRESIPLATPADGSSQQDKRSFDSPFPLLDLPVKIRKQILRMELQRPEMVVPYYYTGCVELADYLVSNPNIDISLLLVNKQLHVEAADTLYGANAFHLSDAQIALWWFRHIGPSNVSRIRCAHFSMYAYPHMNFQIREERFWQKVFCWLEPIQSLTTISLAFEQWKTAGVLSMRGIGRSRIELAREGCIRALAGFRGLRSVEIRGKYMKDEERKILAEIMMLAKGEAMMPSKDDEMELDDVETTPVQQGPGDQEVIRSASNSHGRSKSL